MIATADRQTLAQSILRGLPAAEYHAMDRASASRLNALRRSPLHCRHAIDHPETTAAMELGTAVHTMVLEPGEWGRRYVVASRCHAQTKAGVQCSRTGVEWFNGDWWCQQHMPVGCPVLGEDRIVLTPDGRDQVLAIACAISEHPDARRLLQALAGCEVSVLWTDRQTGADCKGRIDGLGTLGGRPFVLDLKTTADASPRAFARTIHDRGYHVQAAMYADGLAANGVDVESVWFVAVETDAPHAVGVYPLAGTALAVGRAEAGTLLAAWAECRRTGEWRGYETAEIDLPRWAYREE